MKKFVLIFLSILISLAMILPGATAVMADSKKEVTPQIVARPALMMKAPDKGEVGQPVTITVFNRYNHQPVAGVEVYALKIDKVDSTSDQQNYTISTADYAALVDAQGIFLGVTSSEGSVTCKFMDKGRHILVAFKASHFPAFSRIAVTLSNSKALYLKALGVAEVGNSVTMAAFERSSSEPVAKVAIYAQKIGTISVPKPTTGSIFDTFISIFKPSGRMPVIDAKVTKAEPVEITNEVQNVEDVQKRGILLGYTDDNGRLTYTFYEAGNYMLAAIKKDYAPGFASISITTSQQKALGIKAPDRAEVNQAVTITVFERGSSQLVPKAGVYALRLGDLITPVVVPAEKPTTLINTPEPAVLDAAISAETVKGKGIFLGFTDEKGQVMPSFDKTGRYALAAVKDDYQPGFARIQIMPKVVIPHKIDVIPPTTSNKAK